ncbi:CoA transferase subunit A [Ammoniphilus sp. CFH 90114]|uniref:CoA transferase subunit A n=1 Tax=Ammoniphilus sp. CFH 90114 TaxID=2493665 RepID=UPI002107D368|nr:CoA transferase subunit A [Ammoniphilus sp. CFH 90114]
MKRIVSAQEAVSHIHDGATVMIAGFLNAPETLIDALVDSKVKDLTIISNDTCYENQGIGKLIAKRQVKKVITCHIGTNPETQRQMLAGELEVQIVPMGTLVEQVRAGGSGLGGFLTPTGVGTIAAEGKQVIEVNGKTYLLELPLRADVALIQASIADRSGNLFHRKTTRNWSPTMAMAADLVIAQTNEIVDLGDLEPDIVHTPGIFIDYLVQKERSEAHVG